jgi:hypothetical protein
LELPVSGTATDFQRYPRFTSSLIKNGNVRLEGVVANEFDRNIINIKAQGVPGAFSVENDLRIEAKK